MIFTTSPFNGECPAPFLDESLFPSTGGFLPGRNCAPNPLQGANATGACCIPCPVYDYLYKDDFKKLTDGAAWVHVVGFILCGFILISMAVLPVQATKRSFLNVILVVGIMLLELGFIIPLAGQPEQCYNAITPNDMNTSTLCAFSGAFAAFGGMMLVTWVLVRALFMHLQICWDITPSKQHFIGANVAAWTVTISLVAAVLAHAGVSFRFGAYCHVNHTGSIATYWAWLLGLGGLAALFQLATFAYCARVYLQAALLRAAGGAPVSTTRSAESGGARQTSASAAPPAAPSTLSSRSRTARARFRRLKQVLVLQWRSLAIVGLAVGTTAFVCAVFIVLDNKQERLAFANTEALVPWIVCMILTHDNEQCLDKTGPIIIPEEITVATLFVLAFVGVEAFFLLCRVEVFKAWWEFGARVLDREKKAGAASQTEMGLVERGSGLGWLTDLWGKRERLRSGVSGRLVGKDRSLGPAVSAGMTASRAERMPSAVWAKTEENEAEVPHAL